MNFQQIFNEYYTQFRGDSAVPPMTDPEWAIAARYGNTALRRLENVDNEDWQWLWTNASDEGYSTTYVNTSNVPTITTYDGPANMNKPGGWIKFTHPTNGTSFHIDVIDPYLVQLQPASTPYAWWTGNLNLGWTLHINLLGNSYSGYLIDYPYYKTLTYFDTSTGSHAGVNEDGTTVTECPDANFIINYMLAYRLRSTRNYPSYQIAKADAETALIGMQVKNRSGLDGHSWNLNDTSSGVFGVGGYNGFGV